MSMSPVLLISNSIVFLAILIGIAVLQIFLSSKDNKKLGFVLPCINFVVSILVGLIYLLNATLLDVSIFIGIMIVFIAYNVPTIILMAIYYACRSKYSKKHDINKMNIQDLN